MPEISPSRFPFIRASATACPQPVPDAGSAKPASRQANRPVVTAPNRPNIKPGKRTAVSFGPSSRSEAACNQQYRIGLSQNGLPSRPGVSQWPRSTISWATAA